MSAIVFSIDYVVKNVNIIDHYFVTTGKWFNT